MAELLGWVDCIEDDDILDGSELERIAHRAEKPERDDTSTPISSCICVSQLGDLGVRQRAIVDTDIINLAFVGLPETPVLATRVIGVANAKQQRIAGTSIFITGSEIGRSFMLAVYIDFGGSL